MPNPFALVGHRGYPQAYPENTLVGLLAAIAEGADAVEFDIQMSKDGHPVVIHDDTLNRTTGLNAPLADYTLNLLEKISAHEPARFNQNHLPEPIPSLAAVCQALEPWPNVDVFAEIKAEIFSRYSREATMAKLAPLLRPLGARCKVISFDYAILQLAAEAGFSVGWVLNDLSDSSLQQAWLLKPSVLIADKHLLQPTPLWPGPWRWFVYDTVDAKEALSLIKQGVYYLETWDIQGLKQGLFQLRG